MRLLCRISFWCNNYTYCYKIILYLVAYFGRYEYVCKCLVVLVFGNKKLFSHLHLYFYVIVVDYFLWFSVKFCPETHAVVKWAIGVFYGLVCSF